MTQWVIAGIAAPVAGLGGSHTAVPMAFMIVVGTLLAFIGLVIARTPSNPARAPALSGTSSGPC
jgi:DHA1 family bicyclomycin/chloramphenicol resistance-like MFS transporter